MKLVYKYRVKGSGSCRWLGRLAFLVNLVWNFCNDSQRRAVRWNLAWLSAFDLQALTNGSSKELGLGAQTIQGVCETYATSRQTHKKRWLRYRGKRSRGWIPFKAAGIRQVGHDTFKFMGREVRVWLSRPLAGPIRCGSFSQDAQGHWYLNLCCEIASKPSAPTGAIGVDLGIDTVAAMSDGSQYNGMKPFESIEKDLAVAQRARKKKRVQALHAKARNRRLDGLHKLSTRLVRENFLVAVGNVSTQSQLKTRRAKGALDAGWGMFRSMLRYKAIARAVRYEVVDEAYTTQTCSACGALPETRPRGITGLGIKSWVCSACNTSHHRDVNAAVNIRAVALGG